MSISLYDHQRSALEKMKNGCILCGGVGSGKSRTALAYYYLQQGGNLDIPDAPMKNPLDIYIITTARKRDTCEWENELAPFLLSTHEDCNYYKNKVVIDSWNNIGKYKDVKNIRYFASQPWPYPSGLMVGFTAEYEDGELHLQRSELNKGGWFKRDNMPAIPGEVSLARHLIDYWMGRKSK